MWRLYGVFTAIMCVGSCVGVATWVFGMLDSAAAVTFSVNLREYPFPQPNPNYSPYEILSLIATDYLYGACFEFLYPVEVLCICIVKLTVLDRMEVFAAPRDNLHRWVKAGRVTMALVVAGGVAGICGNIVSGVYDLNASSLAKSAASAASNFTNAASIPSPQLLAITDIVSRSQKQNQNATDARSFQAFAEATTLLLIIAAFIFVGVSSARRVDSSLPLMAPHSVVKAKRLRHQIVATAAVVFVTFLLRALFVSFNAVSSSLQNFSAVCLSRSDLCSTTVTLACPVPYNDFTLMQLFLLYTPELQMAVVLISSPLTLLVALWGMTSAPMLRVMSSKKNKKMMDTMRDGMLRGEA